MTFLVHFLVDILKSYGTKAVNITFLLYFLHSTDVTGCLGDAAMYAFGHQMNERPQAWSRIGKENL